jgi:hypothetical protein
VLVRARISCAAFVVPLGVNEIWTVSTIRMHRGDDSSGVEPGLAPIPIATDWPYSQGKGFCHSLSGLPIDAPLVDAVSKRRLSLRQTLLLEFITN